MEKIEAPRIRGASGLVGRALSSVGGTRVRGSPDKTLPCTLMACDACKIRRGGYVLHVFIQIISLGGTEEAGAIHFLEDQN